MKATLRSGEVCPIHHSRTCTPCHKDSPRQSSPSQWASGSRWSGKRIRTHSSPSFAFKKFAPKPAVNRVEDEHYPGGVREICNDREKRRRKLLHIDKQEGLCLLCHEKFERIQDVEFCHKRSRGMKGQWTDDSMENTFAGHRWCNQEQGSKDFNDMEGVA